MAKRQRRKNRTPAELIAELDAKRAALENRAALAQAKSNPAVAPIVEAMETVASQQRESSKTLGSSPQGAESRIQRHRNWIQEIEAFAAYARVAGGAQETASKALSTLLTTSVQALTDGKKVNAEKLEKQVASILEGLQTDSTVSEAYAAFEAAQAARRSFGKEEESEASEG